MNSTPALGLGAILARHSSLLILDAAAAVVQVGWLTRDQPARWVSREGEAGEALFAALRDLDVNPTEADAFGFDEGPGSILGIRTAAVALRVWQAERERPIFAYRSLALVAATLAPAGTTVIADARRNTWHALPVAAAGHAGMIERRAVTALTGPLVTPAGFRHWTPLPEPPPREVSFDLAALWAHPAAAEAPLWHETTEPDAFMHEEASYVTWTPAVHRPPAP
jgi:tRNA threonylcarbamoyladenosine biosynthesis protein TsaB